MVRNISRLPKFVRILIAHVSSPECNTWFDRSKKAPNCLQTLFDIIEAEESKFSETETKKRKLTSSLTAPKLKRPKLSSLNDAGIPFKNIRFGKHKFPPNQSREPGNALSKLPEVLNDAEDRLIEEHDTSLCKTDERSGASTEKGRGKVTMMKPHIVSGTPSSNDALDTSSIARVEHSSTLPSIGYELRRPALSFWAQVKDELCNSGKVQTHRVFLRLMNDYKAGQFDALTLMSEMKDLLQGHGHLLSQFATFFPPQYGYQLGLLGHGEKKVILC